MVTSFSFYPMRMRLTWRVRCYARRRFTLVIPWSCVPSMWVCPWWICNRPSNLHPRVAWAGGSLPGRSWWPQILPKLRYASIRLCMSLTPAWRNKGHTTPGDEWDGISSGISSLMLGWFGWCNSWWYIVMLIYIILYLTWKRLEFYDMDWAWQCPGLWCHGHDAEKTDPGSEVAQYPPSMGRTNCCTFQLGPGGRSIVIFNHFHELLLLSLLLLLLLIMDYYVFLVLVFIDYDGMPGGVLKHDFPDGPPAIVRWIVSHLVWAFPMISLGFPSVYRGISIDFPCYPPNSPLPTSPGPVSKPRWSPPFPTTPPSFARAWRDGSSRGNASGCIRRRRRMIGHQWFSRRLSFSDFFLKDFVVFEIL